MPDQPALLQKHFDTALESPDGIKKLRELILTLAMQGKFTQGESRQIILGDVIELISGQHLLSNEQNEIGKGIPYLTGPADFGTVYPTASRWTEKPKVIAEPGDILLTVKGAGVGKTNKLLSGKTAISRQLMAVRAVGAESNFIHLVLQNAASHFQATMTGIAIPGIGRKEVLNLKFNLPSISEQKRIVAKIDELMALCDKLEAQRNARDNKKLAVHTAVINRLLTAADTIDFDSAWKFITCHFNPLYSVKENVTELKKAILTLAMQGKLVKQDPKDQPASELLKEIQSEKERLVKEGKIKKQKELPPIKPEDLPYEVPDGWVWTRLGDVVSYNGRDNAKPNDINDDTWVLDLEDIEKDTSRVLYRAKYSERQSKSNKSLFQKGDVLYGKLRPYLNKVVVADCSGVCTTEIVPIVPISIISSDYLLWLLKRPAFISHVNSLSYGVKMPRLGTDDAVNSLHPLPPLAEQKHIVAKIDKLMALCDKLETQIDQATAKQTALFDAVLAKV